jgi:hypothetical protein
MTRHRLAGALTAAILGLALAGCTEASPEPTPTASRVAEPTPSADPVVSGPTPRVDATCDDVIDTAALQAFVGERVQPLTAVPAAERFTPDAAAVEQLGALTCRWTNGLDGSYHTGPHPDGQVVELSILPEGLEAAAAYVDVYQSADPTYGEHVQGPRCVADIGYCELAGVIGSAWVELRMDGIVPDAGEGELLAGFRDIVDPLVAAVAVMTPRERWEAEPPSAIRDADCETLTPTDEIAALTAIADLRVGPQWDGPRIGQYWYSAEQVGAMRCSLAISNSDAVVGQIGILPGGAWGVERYADAWIDEGGTAMEIAGVDEGDAIARCTDAASPCIVDVAVDGDWVRVLAYPAPGTEPGSAPSIADYEAARAAVAEIAAIVAGRVLAA